MNQTVDQDGRLNAIEATPSIGRLRILIGFLQGIVAWLLLRQLAPVIYGPASAPGNHIPFWSERHPMLFAALAVITAYLPVIAIAQLPRMRRKTLLIYLLLTCAAVAGLAAYDIWRDPIGYYGTDSRLRVWPSASFGVYATVGLFIVNQLLEHRERGYRPFSEYPRYFEDAWTRGFQLVTSLIFSLLFWGVLELGATLFDLIHVGWFRTMIRHNWFICPALAMAFAAAVHMTDVRPALLTGTRNVVLTLLSWLLPLVIILSLGFLTALLFVGLRPLWETRHAAAILFAACAVTILLLNAAYKDGDPSMPPNLLLRLCGRVAGPVLLPFALIGCYAIALRVNQYGWTPERVTSAAIAVTMLIYSCGYFYAATRRGGWLKPLEAVNVFASLAIIAILVLLQTPIADPARLSVSSQLARLAKGEVSSDKLDYYFLRFDSGVYGRNALARLITGTNEDVRSRASRVQATSFKRFNRQGEPEGTASAAAFSHATIYPRGTQLPQDFSGSVGQVGYFQDPPCMQDGSTCDIYVVPYGKDGKQAIIVRTIEKKSALAPGYPIGASAALFQRDANGKWIAMGTLQNLNCPGVATALAHGELTSAPPEHDDLMVAGVRLEFSAARPYVNKCPAPAPSGSSPQKDQAHDPSAPPQMGPAFGAPAGR